MHYKSINFGMTLYKTLFSIHVYRLAPRQSTKALYAKQVYKIQMALKYSFYYCFFNFHVCKAYMVCEILYTLKHTHCNPNPNHNTLTHTKTVGEIHYVTPRGE